MPTLRPATAIGLVAIAGILAVGDLAARDLWRIRDDLDAGQ